MISTKVTGDCTPAVLESFDPPVPFTDAGLYGEHHARFHNT